MNKLLNELKNKCGNLGIWWHWTALNHEDTFRYFLEKAKPKIALEIGTFQGLTAVLISEYAEEVHTIDIVPYPIQDMIWNMFNCKYKIKNYVCKSSKKKKEIIDSIPFDFAYIDGCHMYESISFDYDLVKHCRNILFHDYWQNNEDWPDVKEFVDSLNLNFEIHVPFAYYRG